MPSSASTSTLDYTLSLHDALPIFRFYKKQEHVSFAVDMENLANSSLPNPLKSMAINGYNFHRSGDILLVYDPQWYDYYGSKAGTTHGSWNPYRSEEHTSELQSRGHLVCRLLIEKKN